jgi:WD40 repeat protein
MAFVPFCAWPSAQSSRDQTARIWESATGQQKLVFNGHAGKPDENGFILAGSVSSVAFSPDGERIASATYDRLLVRRNADDVDEVGQRYRISMPYKSF